MKTNIVSFCGKFLFLTAVIVADLLYLFAYMAGLDLITERFGWGSMTLMVGLLINFLLFSLIGSTILLTFVERRTFTLSTGNFVTLTAILFYIVLPFFLNRAFSFTTYHVPVMIEMFLLIAPYTVGCIVSLFKRKKARTAPAFPTRSTVLYLAIFSVEFLSCFALLLDTWAGYAINIGISLLCMAALLLIRARQLQREKCVF